MSTAACPIPETDKKTDDTTPAAAPAHKLPTSPCPKCGSTEPWGQARWCPNCGYYPALGGTVVDENPPAAQPVQEEKLNLWTVIPMWVRIAALGCLGIAVVNLAIALAFPFGSDARFLIAVTEFGLSLACVFCLHLKAIFYALPRTDKIGPFDLFFNPYRLWKPTFAALPKTWQRVCLLVWMVVAAKCAVFLNGGTDFSRVWEEDWGFERRAQQNLVHAIVEQARKAESHGTLEDGLNGLAGEEEPLETEDDFPGPQRKTDCLIVGYATLESGELDSLIVAAAPFGKLVYAGRVPARTIPVELQQELLDRMQPLERPRPFIHCEGTGTWLQPRLMCRVLYSNWTGDGQLVNPVFKEMLADVETKK